MSAAAQAEALASATAAAIEPTTVVDAASGNSGAISRLNGVLARAIASSPVVEQVSVLLPRSPVPSPEDGPRPQNEGPRPEAGSAEGLAVVASVGASPVIAPNEQTTSVLPLPPRFTYSHSAIVDGRTIAVATIDVAQPSSGYVAVVMSPEAAPRQNLQLVVVLSAATVASLIFLVAVSRGLTRRLRTLAAAAEQIGKGDLTTRVDIRGSDEIAELAKVFNSMAEALQRNRDALAQAVSELADASAELERRAEHSKALLDRTVSAVDEERRRLAAELHDSTIQALQSAAMDAELASLLIERGRKQEAASRLEGLTMRLRDATAELRRILLDLRPPVLDRDGLVPSIERRLAEVRSAREIETALEVSPNTRVPPEHEEVVYRFCQEAIQNAVRHSDCSRLKIRLWQSGSNLRVEVSDDGKGFDPSQAKKPGHLGLLGMEERARLAGGRLVLDAAPGAGTRVELILPVSASAHPRDSGANADGVNRTSAT